MSQNASCPECIMMHSLPGCDAFCGDIGGKKPPWNDMEEAVGNLEGKEAYF